LIAVWTTLGLLSETAQTAAALPAGSIETSGPSAAARPVEESGAGADQAPPAERSAPWTIVVSPSFSRVQTATASPAGSSATWGDSALRPFSERSPENAQAPPPGLLADWTMKSLPSKRVQTAIASPAGPIATCGASAFSPSAERSSAAAQAPPAGLLADWTIRWLPSKRSQTATASPARSTATCGFSALCPSAETSSGISQGPPTGLREDWIMYLVLL
jgi:hypothetical protein